MARPVVVAGYAGIEPSAAPQSLTAGAYASGAVPILWRRLIAEEACQQSCRCTRSEVCC